MKKEIKNRFGVKVGDIFSSSWGYDETHNSFFQVVKVIGETSVRVREINPVVISVDHVGPMSEDITYKLTRDLLPPSSFSVFIKDQKNGDLKRLKSFRADGVSDPQFYLSSFANAYYCKPGTIEVYESNYR